MKNKIKSTGDRTKWELLRAGIELNRRTRVDLGARKDRRNVNIRKAREAKCTGYCKSSGAETVDREILRVSMQ